MHSADLRGVNRLIHRLAIFCLACALTASGQTKITLQQAGSRMPPDFTPKYEGEEVLVSGQVSSNPIWITDSFYLAIQDAGAYGLLLQGTASQFQGLEPGDWVEAQGLLAKRGGRPILLPRDVRRIGHEPPPAPRVLKPKEVASFRYLGVLVTTDSSVADRDENAGGDLLLIDEKAKDLSVFLPRKRRDTGPKLSGFRPGDRIRVTGIASQYCTLPPYDRYFQILIPSPTAVAVLERGWVIQPPVLLASLILAATLAAIWWFRERRMAALRKQMRLLNALGEEVISASSPAEVLRRLITTLQALSNASSVGFYVLNRGTKMLEGVNSAATTELIDPEAPSGAMAPMVAACFRKRTLIAIPDTRRSTALRNDGGAIPRSVLLVPMLAQDELMGVLALHHTERVHYFGESERAAMQHLANQVATALKLQEQQAIREQLFRSEKLAAAGQLISAVANELRSPLQSIALLASSMQSTKPVHELESIADEAHRASDIVARLVSFAKAEQSQVEPVDLNALLSSVLKFRAPEWKAKGIEIKLQLAGKRTAVMASPAQLEQVFLNLLVDAEKSAMVAKEKTIAVSSSLLARRVLVEISCPVRSTDLHRADSAETDHAGSEALGLGVCRGIIQSYGGEFREVRLPPSQVRFEVELPMIETASAGLADASGTEGRRQLTVLVVEPDTKIQRQLVRLLGGRGDRVIPVSSADEGADVAQRLRFDIVICTVRLPGLNWVEFFERVRYRVGGFVLMTDGFDQSLGRAFKNGEGFVLTKPIDETELLRICRTIEERVAVSN
jgi:signal transduction histidine kinase